MMNILFNIVIVLVCLAAVILLVALLMRKRHFVSRSITIHADREKVFDYISLLRNQDSFNKHAMTDGDRKKEFRGTDGTAGYVYAWSGDKSAGEGEKEIMAIVPGKKVEMEIRFIKPMKVNAQVIMETESAGDHQTKVTWINTGVLKFPINIMIPMMEKSVAKGMEESLSTLKKILEK